MSNEENNKQDNQNRGDKKENKEFLKADGGNKSGRDIITVSISKETLHALAQAARNSVSLDEAALEIETVNPAKITLDSSLYMLKSKPANDKISKKEMKKATNYNPKVVGIVSVIVDTLSNKSKPGCITINGSIDVPKTGRRIVKLDECIFSDEVDAREVARVLTEIELERATEMMDEATEAVNFIRKQLEDDRF